jgi:uncharacterized phiE125 gp8 family phage protein
MDQPSLTRKIVTPPVAEPITIDEAKEHLRLDSDLVEHDEFLIPRLIVAAREWVEKVCNRVLITQTWDVYFEAFDGDCLCLPFGSLQQVSQFDYTDAAGVVRPFAIASGNVLLGSAIVAHIDTVSEPCEIELASSATWPSDTLKTVNPIRVRIVCGYGASGASVPASIKQAMLLLIDHWYRNTSDVVVGQSSSITSSRLERSVNALLENYRL